MGTMRHPDSVTHGAIKKCIGKTGGPQQEHWPITQAANMVGPGTRCGGGGYFADVRANSARRRPRTRSLATSATALPYFTTTRSRPPSFAA
jgi:hypothetical protein